MLDTLSPENEGRIHKSPREKLSRNERTLDNFPEGLLKHGWPLMDHRIVQGPIRLVGRPDVYKFSTRTFLTSQHIEILSLGQK